MIDNKKTRAFLKWAGGKYAILDRILPNLPAADWLVEPFFGAGSVALNSAYSNFVLNDINHDLINLYKIVQRDPHGFIDASRAYFSIDSNQRDFYFDTRAQFNQTTDKRLRAVMFLYMNRHGYNGLCRYNSSGKFNVPFGRYVKPKFPENEIIEFAEKFKSAKFSNNSFEKTMRNAPNGSVIYCDPPYHPLTATASFTQYSANSFGQAEQKALAKLASQVARDKRCTVVISNHDTLYTRELYKEAALVSFPVKRYISQNANTRLPVQELIAVFTHN